MNIFAAMRNAPQEASMTVEEAIRQMDCLVSSTISSSINRRNGVAGLNAEEAKKLFQRATKAAQIVYATEKSGSDLSKNFFEEDWKDLLEHYSVEEVRKFALSSAMHPSVCSRIILSKVSD
jgi:hypothetical protein